MRKSYFKLEIDGQDVTSRWMNLLMHLAITDSEGGKSDQLEAELDDEGGRIELPRVGATVHAELGWRAGECITFDGKTDEPHSRGARGGGMTLSISAKSADPSGKGKEPQKRHKDNSSFGDVAKEWGGKVGLSVMVDQSLASVHREYWDMAHESFHAWGARIARDIGATFKVFGDKAVFVPRGSSAAASGAQMSKLLIKRPGNVISWDMTPVFSRTQFTEHIVRWYDVKEAKWKTEKVTVDNPGGAKASLTDRFKHADSDRAKSRAKSNKDEADRKKGGGTIKLDGEPAARSQAEAEVSGIRPGINGTYKVTKAVHARDRHGGYQTTVTLEQPGGDAGTDSRGAGANAGSGAGANAGSAGEAGVSNSVPGNVG